ncbi:MAG TPA: hypothetical protein VK714_14735 [Myxococcota bacterium]|nr:hypothetical protein [Myxococcota bacterium]
MAKSKKKPGPKADRLKLPGDWQTAVKRALEAKRPAEGWPKPEPRSKAPKKKNPKDR